MPIVTVETNLGSTQLPEDFSPSLSKFISEVLGKPESRVSISLITDRQMVRGGSSAPFLQLHLAAVGVVSNADQTRVHSPKIFEFLQERTGLSQDRIVVLFYPLEPWQVGLDGTIVS